MSLSWRLPGFGLIIGLVLITILWFLGPVAAGPTLFFGITLAVAGIGIFIGATRTKHLSLKLRAFSEWILIGVVWILISLIVLTILTIR